MPTETDVSVLPDTVFLMRIVIVLFASTCIFGAIPFVGSMQQVELMSVGKGYSYAPNTRDVSLRNISDIQTFYAPVN